MAGVFRYCLAKISQAIQKKASSLPFYHNVGVKNVVQTKAVISRIGPQVVAENLSGKSGLFRYLLPRTYTTPLTGNSPLLQSARRQWATYGPRVWQTFRQLGFGARAANNPSTRLLYLSLGFVGVAMHQHQHQFAPRQMDSSYFGMDMTEILRRQWKASVKRENYNFKLLHNYVNKRILSRTLKMETQKQELQQRISSLKSLTIGEYLAKGCDGAICSAMLSQEPMQDDLAVKILFNYADEMEAFDFAAEAMPLRAGLCHANVVQQLCEFQDENVLHTLPVAQEFSAACRADLFPCVESNSVPVEEDVCTGTSRTTYILMEKHDMTLRELLQSGTKLSFLEVVQILVQLLEALVHLQERHVAHRDIKLDNILVTILPECESNHDSIRYRVALADFGHSVGGLVGSDLQLPYPEEGVSLGGNPALMAPEIYCSRPGPDCVLSYATSDMWSVATLVYDMLGMENPFYHQHALKKPYVDKDLPPLKGVPQWFDILVRQCMLPCEPARRLSTRACANLLHFYCLHLDHGNVQQDESTPPLAQLWHRFLAQLDAEDGNIMEKTTKIMPLGKENIHEHFIARITSAELLRCVYWFQLHAK